MGESIWIGGVFTSHMHHIDVDEDTELESVEFQHGIDFGAGGAAVDTREEGLGGALWQSHAGNLELKSWLLDGTTGAQIGGTSSSDEGNLNNLSLQDIAAVGDQLYLAAGTDKIFRWEMPATHSGFEQRDADEVITVSGGLGLFGITHDGSQFWITHDENNQSHFYTVNPSDGASTHQFTLSFSFIWWLAWGYDHLWAFSDGEERIWKLDPSDGSTVDSWDSSSSWFPSSPNYLAINPPPEPEAPPFKPLRIIQRWSQQGKSYS